MLESWAYLFLCGIVYFWVDFGLGTYGRGSIKTFEFVSSLGFVITGVFGLMNGSSFMVGVGMSIFGSSFDLGLTVGSGFDSDFGDSQSHLSLQQSHAQLALQVQKLFKLLF